MKKSLIWGSVVVAFLAAVYTSLSFFGILKSIAWKKKDTRDDVPAA